MRYTLRFLRKAGCERVILDDMARHDSATVLSTTTDADCHDDCVRSATLDGRFAPTMDRWRSFVVGARIEQED